MDRFIVREQRATTSGYPGPGRNDRTVSFVELPSASMIPETVYYQERYGSEYPSLQQNDTDMNNGYMRMVHANNPPFQQAGINASSHLQTLKHGQGQYMSGIDRNYLAAYSSNNAGYIATPATNNVEPRVSVPSTMGINPAFGRNFENRDLMGPERTHVHPKGFSVAPSLVSAPLRNQDRIMKRNQTEASQGLSFSSNSHTKEQKVNESLKNKEMPEVPTRAEKIKALHKTGSRAFSGPVEKVIKWHKALQDMGLLVIYEIVAKCVSIRSGESSAKHLVIRDDNGPAIQVVYYEIDFLLPEIKPPCTVRVVGKMMAGTSRFQAFNIRPATGDDVAIQPRRAAVANHHVAKLCKEYGVSLQP